MRDFRDAKTMAHALRDALKAKAIETTHSEALELIAKAFGYDNWNILSAKIEATEPRAKRRAHPRRAGSGVTTTLYCSFCGKSQHEVRKLIAGPTVFICDECVDICTDIVDDPEHDEKMLRLMQGDEASARAMPTEELVYYVERGKKGVERNRLALHCIERRLATRPGEVPAEDDILAQPRFGYLKDKTPDEITALQTFAQQALRRYEEALRLAAEVLGERSLRSESLLLNSGNIPGPRPAQQPWSGYYETP